MLCLLQALLCWACADSWRQAGDKEGCRRDRGDLGSCSGCLGPPCPGHSSITVGAVLLEQSARLDTVRGPDGHVVPERRNQSFRIVTAISSWSHVSKSHLEGRMKKGGRNHEGTAV